MQFEFDVFICYSRKDARFVDRLTASLREAHVRVWRDTLRLRVGDQHVAEIVEAVDKSRFFAFVISPAAMASYFITKIELQSAFNRMIADRRKSFVLPILRGASSVGPSLARSLEHASSAQGVSQSALANRDRAEGFSAVRGQAGGRG